MTEPIPINLAVEDALSEAVLRVLLNSSDKPYAVGACYTQAGFGYLRKSIRGFNNAAKGCPFLVLTDLDSTGCAPELMQEWLPDEIHKNLLFRVAVRSVEAWLLGHREGIAGFLGVSASAISESPDDLPNPKAALIELARRSRKSGVAEDLVPRAGMTSVQGPNYNGRLISFVAKGWRPELAMKNSPSLARTLRALGAFEPHWT